MMKNEFKKMANNTVMSRLTGNISLRNLPFHRIVTKMTTQLTSVLSVGLEAILGVLEKRIVEEEGAGRDLGLPARLVQQLQQTCKKEKIY
jgi:hypothetical protein